MEKAHELIKQAKVLGNDGKDNLAVEALQNAVKYVPDNDKRTMFDIFIGTI